MEYRRAKFKIDMKVRTIAIERPNIMEAIGRIERWKEDPIVEAIIATEIQARRKAIGRTGKVEEDPLWYAYSPKIIPPGGLELPEIRRYEVRMDDTGEIEDFWEFELEQIRY